jgi:transposase IS4-like protein/DDE family transposase
VPRVGDDFGIDPGQRPVGELADLISLGVLASAVPREVVDEAVAAHGRGAKRSGGKLPPHVMVYFAMAMALFGEDDYEEVMVRLSATLASWKCWDGDWVMPTSGGITQARARLGFEPVAEVFDQVAVPVADALTRGAWLGPWRLMAVDGFDWDVPDTVDNVAEFGYAGSGTGRSSFPKVRLVTISECGSHAVVAAELGGANAAEQKLARRLYPGLEPDWLLIADRNFYGFVDWNAARAQGCELLWRVSSSVTLPVVRVLVDGSYLSVVFRRWISRGARPRLLEAARRGEELDPADAVLVRVVEYAVPGRASGGHSGSNSAVRAGRTSDDRIVLITSILDPFQASAQQLAQAYHQRWEHETGNGQIKTHLRGPGKVLRSRKPDTVRQEIYGFLLAHYAVSALICRAATEADIDPDRVKFLRTVRVLRHEVIDSGPFPP